MTSLKDSPKPNTPDYRVLQAEKNGKARAKKARPTYQLTLWLVSSCLCIAFLWASFAQVNLHVRGIGKIIPSGKVRTIQHLEGGIINEILIQEGQIVKQGDILFKIANSRAEAEMKEIQVALDALTIEKIRLQNEFDLKEELSFPEYYQTNYANLCNSETQIFFSRLAEYQEMQNRLKKQMNQKVLTLDEMESTIQNTKREMKNAQQQLDINTKLLRSGAISRSKYLETDSKVKNFQTRISKLTKEIPVTKSEISEILSLLEEAKQNRRTSIGQELTEANVSIHKLNERIKSFNDAVSRKDVLSSLNGVVKKVNFNTIGGVVQSGEILAEIIPLQETLVVEANIATQDRGKVWVGLPVIAKITAYDYSVYGGVNGELTYISADSFTNNQNQQFYQVRVELQKSEIREDKPIVPGMAVDVNILANKVSILEAILRPIRNIRDNALREI